MEFPRIIRDPGVMEGKPCVRDLGITVATIVGLFGSGHSQGQILELYRNLTGDDIREALLYASKRLLEPEAGGARLPVEGREKASAVERTPVDKLPMRGNHPVKTEAPISEDRLEYGPAGKEPRIVITRAGLYDRRLCADIFAWADIHEISLPRDQYPQFVFMELRNPGLYLSRMPAFQRFRARFQMIFTNPRFCISSSDAGISARELYVHIKRIWIVHRSGTEQIDVPSL